MGKIRRIIGYTMLPLLFLWYIGGITLFPHTHIVDGVRIVHSHPNPDAEHQNGSDYLTIHMLAQFQSCGAEEGVILPEVFRFLVSETDGKRDVSTSVCNFHRYFRLRAPPAA